MVNLLTSRPHSRNGKLITDAVQAALEHPYVRYLGRSAYRLGTAYVQKRALQYATSTADRYLFPRKSRQSSRAQTRMPKRFGYGNRSKRYRYGARRRTAYRRPANRYRAARRTGGSRRRWTGVKSRLRTGRRAPGYGYPNPRPRARFPRGYGSLTLRRNYGQRAIVTYHPSVHDANIVEPGSTTLAAALLVTGTTGDSFHLFGDAIIPLKTAIGGAGRDTVSTTVMFHRIRLIVTIPTPRAEIEQDVRWIIIRRNVEHDQSPLWFGDTTDANVLFQSSSWTAQRNPVSRRAWTIIKQGKTTLFWHTGIRKKFRQRWDIHLRPYYLMWKDATTTPTSSNSGELLRKGELLFMIRYQNSLGTAAGNDIPSWVITQRLVYNPRH